MWLLSWQGESQRCSLPIAKALFYRPHYWLIARTLDKLPLEARVLDVVAALSEAFKRDNPQFVPAIFEEWATESK